MQKASEVLDRAILYILYGLILSFTLICCPGFESPFLLVKATVLRVTAAVLLLLWTVSCALSGKLKWRRTPLDLPLAGLLLTGIVSTVFSMNRLASLAGSVRSEGLWMMFIYALIYYLSAWYLGRDGRWLTALRLFALSSLAPALITGLQLVGVDFSGLFDRNVITYMGTFGNYPFYGYFLVLVLPVFAYLAWREKNKWLRAALIAGGAVNLAIIPLTGNRAATLGFLVMGAAFLVMLVLRSHRRRRVILVGLALMILVVIILFGAFWGTSYGEGLRSAIKFGSDENIQGRFSLWRSTLRMIADRPLQGYGLESFPFDYQRYMEPIVNEFGMRENSIFFWENPHNQALYMGVSLGVGGIIFYLLLYGVLFWWLGRGFRRSDDPWFYGAVLCAVIGYFVCVQFLSDLPTVTPYLWVLLGLAVGRPHEPAEGETVWEGPDELVEEDVRPGETRRKWLRVTLSAASILLAAALCITSVTYAVRFQLADRHYFLAKNMGKEPAGSAEELSPVIEELKRAVSLNPLNYEYRTPLAQLLFTQSQAWQSTSPAWEAAILAREAIKDYPTDSRSFVLLGSAYTYIYLFSGNSSYKQMAKEQFETALELYPYSQDARKALELLKKY